MKKVKIAYWISTGLLTALMSVSIGMYFFNNAEISKVFVALGHPAYLVYPLGVAKVLGLIAIWSNLSKSLKEWAYAGFFFDFVLAAAAHIAVGDGEYAPALVATVLLFASYFSYKKVDTASN